MENKIINKDKYYSLEDLEMLLDNIPYKVWIKGEDGKFKYVNKAFENILSVNKEDIINMKSSECFSKEINDYLEKRDMEILNSKTGILIEENIIFKGENRCFETYFSKLCKKNKNSIMGISREVTLDKNMMYEIGKNTSNLLNCNYNKKEDDFEHDKGLNKIINDLKKRLECDGISVFLKDKNLNKLTLTLKCGTAMIIEDKYTLYIDEKVKQELISTDIYSKARNIRESDSFLEWEKSNKFKYDDSYYGYIRVYPIKYENELLGVLNIFYNDENIPKYKQDDFIKFTCEKFGMIIKNRMLSKALKKELDKRKKSEKELKAFLEIATDLWGILGIDQKFKNVSQNCIEALGWSKEELLNMNAFNIVHPEDRERAIKLIDYSNECGKGEYLTVRVLCKNGEYKLFEWNWSCIEKEKLVYIVGKDINHQKILEKEKKKLEKAIELENFKNDFFANVSHEFKTPLNIILATVQLMNSKDANTIDNKYISVPNKYINGIKQNAYRLLRLVNNLIDITKIDGGYYTLNLENYNIVTLIEDIISSVTEYIGGKGRKIVFDTNDEEVILAIDPDKFETIILNLLSNSIKYTDTNGIIEVNLKVNREEQKIIVSVKDDGIGIPEKNLETIFERFKQSENIFTRRCEGSGIGLALVKSLVEMHGGTIIAKNNETKGAEIIFDIPIKLIELLEKNNISNRLLEAKIERCNVEFSDIYSL
ncbi:PAS domain-containing sensor histidine kinase [Clostridium weizhouense]|uniref:histidine kinase n=1 Tax=Clostridium weizhouense TaxID=2859781 RepID=A0ABS7ALC1_9CLOT|nr:ATP-binding protein [Clostridium weizhouense]MBW6409464.1 PAS domain S-box protein [Clostridium weizhouense]